MIPSAGIYQAIAFQTEFPQVKQSPVVIQVLDMCAIKVAPNFHLYDFWDFWYYYCLQGVILSFVSGSIAILIGIFGLPSL